MGEAGLLVFDSTNVALKTERMLKGAGVTLSVIPTPLEVSAGCGIALLVKGPWMQEAREALEGHEGYRLLYPYRRNG